MHSLLALAAPLALMLPTLAQSGVPEVPPAAPDSAPAPAPQCSARVAQQASPSSNPLTAFLRYATARQVRIEQRVVIRIAPAARQNVIDDLPQRAVPRMEERGKEKCVPLDGIAGVQTGSGNRLVLYLRDQRMISVNLEKSCRARDFYSGFYVEKNKDGRLCVDRDTLQSRTGARCEVETMRRLVEVTE